MTVVGAPWGEVASVGGGVVMGMMVLSDSLYWYLVNVRHVARRDSIVKLGEASVGGGVVWGILVERVSDSGRACGGGADIVVDVRGWGVWRRESGGRE